ncbi:hypothetical protein M5K25_016442 [Dendrobium thyrsiflorum]|uniref:Uncharacterized protein n=1 Tax=Dendrobium thyrsiflorum TaxID=117978 RepID=A0ABD0UK43_DENTH
MGMHKRKQKEVPNSNPSNPSRGEYLWRYGRIHSTGAKKTDADAKEFGMTGATVGLEIRTIGGIILHPSSCYEIADNCFSNFSFSKKKLALENTDATTQFRRYLECCASSICTMKKKIIYFQPKDNENPCPQSSQDGGLLTTIKYGYDKVKKMIAHYKLVDERNHSKFLSLDST